MARSTSARSLEKTRTRAGYSFVMHWLIGLALFFVYPLVCSLWYSFNNILIEPGSVVTQFVGLEHYRELLTVSADYLDNMRDSMGMMFYSLPFILALSLILAVLLNQNFKGKTVFRAIFFLPAIISNSVVMSTLNGDFITMPLFSSGTAGTGIINYNEIIANLNIPSQITPILVFLLSNSINIIWKCGVQTVLFIAGLQSIPASLYEVSKLEGANKWEEFWLITVPSLQHIISLVLIYTMIELFVDTNNTLVANAYSRMLNQDYGNSSAMLWLYFAVVLVVIGAIYLLYQRYCVKHWE